MNYGMTLRTLLEGLLEQAPDIAISGITQDPARIERGFAFVAMPGDRGYDPDALRTAVANGCVAVLHGDAGKLPRLDVPAVRVPELGGRLGEIASRFWAAPSDLMTIAGVAGARGRASVSYFLAQVWQRFCGAGGLVAGFGSGSMESLLPANGRAPDVFSLNETLAACIDDGIDHVAVEVSPQALLQGRCQTLQIDLAVITNLHPGRDGAVVEKRLFTEFAPRFAVVNCDDPLGRCLVGQFEDSSEILGFGLDPAAELSGRIMAMDPSGMDLQFTGPWGATNIHTDLSGEASARQLLAAAGALTLLGMDWGEVCRQLEFVTPVPGIEPRVDSKAGASRAWERAA